MSAGEQAPPPPPEARADRDAATPLARRLGPIVAALGLLGVLVTVVWIAFAPDNVVGTVAEAGIVVPGTAVTAVGEDVDVEGCLRLVEGDGSDRRLCPDVDGIVDPTGARWTEDGRLVVPTREGEVVVDPTTGAAEPATDEQGYPEPVFREDVHTDGSVVRRGQWGSDGPVVLDLGGPVGRLEVAVQSPDGRWVVAVDGDGRVLVSEAAAPTQVHVWFEVDEDSWFDPWTALRWER